ncbi:M14 family metallopeptidase [soil metagenome]
MPRAKLKDLDGYVTTSRVAKMFDLSTYLIKTRIEDGTFPAASRTSDSGVLLFDQAWIASVRDILRSTPPRKRRPHSTAKPLAPSPKSFLGHEMGEAGWLPGWDDVIRYFEALAAASDRVETTVLGQSTEGRPYIVVAVSAPENVLPDARQRNREALAKLWDARHISQEDVDSIVGESRSVGIVLASQHSNEIGAMLMTMQLAYDLAVATDQPTLDLLGATIALFVPSHNPDGIEMISKWYERWLGTPWEGVGMPWLYHPYVGHDNNRDWFMQTQPETRIYFDLHNREHPQAVFDMHQMGRLGPRFMVPPFIDPLDPNQDPLIQQGFAALGSHIAQRLTAAGKPGVVTNAIFDNYSPSLAYGNYHGSVDLLSEAASAKLATTVQLEEDDLNDDYGIDPTKRAWNQPLVWKCGSWSLADIVSYNLVAARAFLDHLARNRRQWLGDYAAHTARIAVRDEKPYAFVFPPDQRDPRATAELLATLQRGLVEVHEARGLFIADGIEFPAGSHVVRLDQPGGAFAKTLLEIQDYPDLRKWPNGPVREPYDISGHTLPIQMGVRAIQIDEPLPDEIPLELLTQPVICAGSISAPAQDASVWIVDARSNAVSATIQELHRRSVPVYRAKRGDAASGIRIGDALVPISTTDRQTLAEIVGATGATIHAASLDGDIAVWRQNLVRLAVYKPWTASIDEGWARWVLEEYGYPYETVTTRALRQGNLRPRFDALLIPEMSAEDVVSGRPEKTTENDSYPPEYVGGLGEAGLESLRRFVADGGTLIAIDRATTAVVDALALPVENPMRDLTAEEFSCPGSLLRVVMDTTHPLGLGMPRETAVLFMSSVVFEGASDEVTTIGRYPNSNPRLSGWINGASRIEGKNALVDVAYGEGRAVLVGFRPYFRAQARGTYRILFNAIDRAGFTDTEFPNNG